jgi:hypothetical protein
MARKIEQWAESLSTEQLSGWLTGFLAEEDVFDRRALFRLASWGAGALGALIIAILAGQSSSGQKRELLVAADLSRQAQQIQTVAKDSQSDSRRLALAIDTLGSDRDRLYSRMTVIEQSLDSVTGLLARLPKPGAQAAVEAPPAPAALAPPPQVPVAAAPPSTDEKTPAKVADNAKVIVAPKVVASAAAAPAPLPVPAPVASPQVADAATAKPAVPPNAAPAASAPPSAAYTSLVGSKSIMAPPDPAAAKLSEPAAATATEPTPPPVETVASIPSTSDATPIAVGHTEFGVDLGGANSVAGLRALWRGLKSNTALAGLRPIIVVKERSSGLGMQLRLVAGPLNDAAAAAKFCAPLTESGRACETSVFDGQRLAVKDEQPKIEAPKTGTPRAEAPKTESPQTEATTGEPARAEQAKPIRITPLPPPRRQTQKRASQRTRPVEQRSERPEEPAQPRPRSWLQSVLGIS